MMRYSLMSVLSRGVRRASWPPAWRRHDLKDEYDVVIIGAGVHGLACAYYLAKNHGISKVAVLDKGYVGGGGSGRNTAIIRSNYLTPEGVAFYDRSLRLYRDLSIDLNMNVMFSRRGHLTLAHSDASMRTMRWRAEVNKLQGVESSVIDLSEIARIVPALDTSDRPHQPIMGALYHPPGGIVRHDAVNWGYARGADSLGVEIHEKTEVLDIRVTGGEGVDGKGAGGRVVGVRTTQGDVDAPVIVNCTAGWGSTIAAMAGVSLPLITHPLQAAVTEPVGFFLPAVVVSGSLHVYVSQTPRGELVLGASIDPVGSYSMRGSLEFVEELATHALELMPGLGKVRLLRQWAGLCDMTPDYSPIMGFTPVDGFLCDVGWGTYGFKAGPVSGEQMAAAIATSSTPDLISAFSLDRFVSGRLVGEKGAASVGH